MATFLSPFPLLLLLFLLRSTSSLSSSSGFPSSTENVYITSSYGQLVTSSTLRWQWTDSDSSFFRDNSVIKATSRSSSSVCRGWHQNQMVPGGTDNKTGKCAVGSYGKLVMLDKYQVMVDPTKSARVEWRKWNIFTKLPVGMVAYTDEKEYVARHGGHAGDLNPRRGLSGDIQVLNIPDSKSETATEGEILVEVEPVKYELRDTQLHMERAKVSHERLHLGSRVLSSRVAPAKNGEEIWSTVRAVVAYNASYYYYYGQHPGMIRGLASVGENLDKDKKIEFRWGIPLSYDRHRILEVSSDLQPRTSVQCSASAVKVTTEVPYTAKLVSHFDDGKSRKRRIDGTYVETTVKEVNTDYGRPYFTHNGTHAPTTTTTATTTISTTVTTTIRPQPVVVTSTTTLRPRRSTSPLPTRPNPLLRFYPEDDKDGLVVEEDNRMLSDDGTTNRRRSSPMMSSARTHHQATTLSVSVACGVLVFDRLLQIG